MDNSNHDGPAARIQPTAEALVAKVWGIDAKIEAALKALKSQTEGLVVALKSMAEMRAIMDRQTMAIEELAHAVETIADEMQPVIVSAPAPEVH